ARARDDRPEESSMTTIRTSHAGSLPRTPGPTEANKVKQAQNTARLAGESVSDAQEKEFDELLAASVADLVKRQKNLGISLPNDGEYGHAMAADFDYGAWWHYSFARTGGLELHDRNINAPSTASASRIANEYYKTDEEFIWAWADVLREEYLAITEAGLTVQIDDPSLAENFDQINPEPSYDDYRAFIQVRIDAL